MNRSILHRESALQERVNILKRKGYRGFQILKSSQKPEFTFEVSASNSYGFVLIAMGDTLDEAFENLIERIDITLDS